MSNNNPFNDSLDWALQGKLVRVHTAHRTYDGWVERVHHQRGSVILHDVEVRDRLEGKELSDPEDRGSVFIRSPEEVEVLTPKKRIDHPRVEYILPSPYYDADYHATDHHTRRAYRNQYTGSFPVARTIHTEEEPQHYELINGHKRIAAAKRAGMTHHPVEVIDVDDETAKELVELAHSPDDVTGDPKAQSLEEYTDGSNEDDN